MRLTRIFAIVLTLSLAVPVLGDDTPHEHYIRLDVSSRAQIEALTELVSIDRVEDGRVWAYASPAQISRLRETGLIWTEEAHPGKNPGARMGLLGRGTWDAYPTYEEYLTMMQQWADDPTYSAICRLVDLGDSQEGRELWALKISDNPDLQEDEPEVLYTSSMHGDETVGYVLTLRLIEELLMGYGSDPELTNLVNELEIWINPLANPDGTYYGGNHTVANAVRYLANWVDANRNFPDPRAGDHPDGNAWAQETVAMMNLAHNKSFVLSANFHGGIELVNYPWDTWCRRHPDDQWFYDLSLAYATQAQADGPAGYMDYCAYPGCSGGSCTDGVTNGADWYIVAGGRQDYMVYWHGTRETTIELSNTKNPNASTLPTYWTANRQALIDYLGWALTGLRGVVTGTGGLPLGARIEIVGYDTAEDRSSVTTDNHAGDYHRMLLPGSYTVRTTVPWCADSDESVVVVTSGPATRHDVALACDPLIFVDGFDSGGTTYWSNSPL